MGFLDSLFSSTKINSSNLGGQFVNRNQRLALTGGLSGLSDLKQDLTGGGGSNPSTYASDTFAALTRDRWAQYVKTFVPIENQLIDYATNPNTVSNAMSSASTDVTNAYSAQPGAMQRRLSSLGVSLNPDEQAAAAKSSNLSEGLANVQAQNLARDTTIQRQQQILGNPAPNVAQAGTAAMGV